MHAARSQIPLKGLAPAAARLLSQESLQYLQAHGVESARGAEPTARAKPAPEPARERRRRPELRRVHRDVPPGAAPEAAAAIRRRLQIVQKAAERIGVGRGDWPRVREPRAPPHPPLVSTSFQLPTVCYCHEPDPDGRNGG